MAIAVAWVNVADAPEIAVIVPELIVYPVNVLAFKI
jgi:hypothetical protein